MVEAKLLRGICSRLSKALLRPLGPRAPALSVILFGLGCASELERRAHSNFAQTQGDRQQEQRPATKPDSAPSAGPLPVDTGSDQLLARYVQLALKNHPKLEARYRNWQARTHRITQARGLPDPVLSYGYYAQSVETRVGPQRHRFAIQQTLPWPGKLNAQAGAASFNSEAARRKFEAEILSVAREVNEAYYKCWWLDRSSAVHQQELLLLRQLSESVGGRLEVGQASLADLTHIHLQVAKTEDYIAELAEGRLRAQADLAGAIGDPTRKDLPVAKAPPPVLAISEDEQALRASIERHPYIDSFSQSAASQEQQAIASRAARYPSLTIGAQYIETGSASTGMPDDSGKDALILNASVSLPVWVARYEASEQEARATKRELLAARRQAEQHAQTRLMKLTSTVRDTARRIELHKHSLLPQAETAYDSVLGAFQVGRARVSEVIIAQRELLSLRLSQANLESQHAIAWAQLEALVGRKVRGRKLGGAR